MKFTEEHEWLRPEGDIVVVGITEHATEQLGDLVFVELPEVGSTVAKDDEIVVIESVKAASDVYAPIHGKVVEVNGALSDKPETVNESPTEKGWFCVLEIKDGAEIAGLMDEAAYKAYCETL